MCHITKRWAHDCTHAREDHIEYCATARSRGINCDPDNPSTQCVFSRITEEGLCDRCQRSHWDAQEQLAMQREIDNAREESLREYRKYEEFQRKEMKKAQEESLAAYKRHMEHQEALEKAREASLAEARRQELHEQNVQRVMSMSMDESRAASYAKFEQEARERADVEAAIRASMEIPRPDIMGEDITRRGGGMGSGRSMGMGMGTGMGRTRSRGSGDGYFSSPRVSSAGSTSPPLTPPPSTPPAIMAARKKPSPVTELSPPASPAAGIPAPPPPPPLPTPKTATTQASTKPLKPAPKPTPPPLPDFSQTPMNTNYGRFKIGTRTQPEHESQALAESKTTASTVPATGGAPAPAVRLRGSIHQPPLAQQYSSPFVPSAATERSRLRKVPTSTTERRTSAAGVGLAQEEGESELAKMLKRRRELNGENDEDDS